MDESIRVADWDNDDYIADHLGVACWLARREGRPFLAYMIEMAILAQMERETGRTVPMEPMLEHRV